MNAATKRRQRIARYLPATNGALSPRNPPPAIQAGIAGTTGRATYGQPSDPTLGRHGSGDGRLHTRNTMRNARMGGSRISYFEPAEVDATPRPTAHAPARTANRAYDAGHIRDIRAAGIAEGIRQSAMARHSILTTTGAVDVIPRTGPVWLGDNR